MKTGKTFNEILHEQMFGYSLGGKEPIQNFIVRDIGSDFRKALKPLAPAFIKRVTGQAAANGLPPQYVNYIWWLIYEKPNLWPPLEKKEMRALLLGRDIVAAEYMMPKYNQGLQAPTPNFGAAVNATVKGIAKATKREIMVEGSKAFMVALRKNAPRLKRAYPTKFATDKDAQFTLMGFVKTALFKYRSWFKDVGVQDGIVNSLLA